MCKDFIVLFDVYKVAGKGNSLRHHCGADGNAKTEFFIIHVVHYQIACRLSYYISYIMVMAYQELCTQNSLVLHQIDSGLSYFAFYMHRVGSYGLLIMTFGGGRYW
jgi:hypothetical protein